MFMRILSLIGVMSMGLLVYILLATTPAEAGAIGVLAVFLLFYIVSVVVLTFFIVGIQYVIGKLVYGDTPASEKYRKGVRRPYYFASVLALGPVMLVSLRSVGSIGVTEVFLVAILMAIGYLYVSRQTA